MSAASACVSNVACMRERQIIVRVAAAQSKMDSQMCPPMRVGGGGPAFPQIFTV
jgi:hypothetical protein